MKFGANLGILEPVTCGPDNMARNALWYWEGMYKYLSAAGFPGFEVVYKPWDFNLGRSGMPYTKASMETFYGSLEGFRKHLIEIGIPEMIALNISAEDVIADYEVRGLDVNNWLEGLVEFAEEAIESASSLGAEGVVVYPTPTYAFLYEHGFLDGEDSEKKILTDVIAALNRMNQMAKEKNVKLAVRNTYWSLIRDDKIDFVMDQVDQDILFSPDAASFYITGGDILSKIRKYGDRIGFVLMNDTFFEDKHEIYRQPLPEYPQTGVSRVYCMVGYGKVDTKGIVAALAGEGYEGWVVCGSHDATNVPKAILDLSWYITNVLKKRAGE